MLISFPEVENIPMTFSNQMNGGCVCGINNFVVGKFWRKSFGGGGTRPDVRALDLQGPSLAPSVSGTKAHPLLYYLWYFVCSVLSQTASGFTRQLYHSSMALASRRSQLGWSLLTLLVLFVQLIHPAGRHLRSSLNGSLTWAQCASNITISNDVTSLEPANGIEL